MVWLGFTLQLNTLSSLRVWLHHTAHLVYLALAPWEWIYQSLLDCLFLYFKLKDVTMIQLKRMNMRRFNYKNVEIYNMLLNY